MTLVFGVYDSVAEELGPLFYAKNAGVAQRQYNNLLEDIPEDSRGDFKLICLMQFDKSKWVIVNSNVPVESTDGFVTFEV